MIIEELLNVRDLDTGLTQKADKGMWVQRVSLEWIVRACMSLELFPRQYRSLEGGVNSEFWLVQIQSRGNCACMVYSDSVLRGIYIMLDTSIQMELKK